MKLRLLLLSLAFAGPAAPALADDVLPTSAVPMRALAAEELLLGAAWDVAAMRKAQSMVERTLTPMGDHRGSAAYRMAMAQSLTAKFQFEAAL